MAKPFAVQMFRSDVASSERRTFKRWAIYIDGEHFADVNATSIPGYRAAVSITTPRGRVLAAKRGKKPVAW